MNKLAWGLTVLALLGACGSDESSSGNGTPFLTLGNVVVTALSPVPPRTTGQRNLALLQLNFGVARVGPSASSPGFSVEANQAVGSGCLRPAAAIFAVNTTTSAAPPAGMLAARGFGEPRPSVNEDHCWSRAFVASARRT